MPTCNADKILLENICDFEKKEILTKNTGKNGIDSKQLAVIFYEEHDSIHNLIVL